MVLERDVKRALKIRLDNLGTYWVMPVQRGMGKATLDFLVCWRGLFFGIETKRPGEVPSPRQELIIETIQAAGGRTLVIDNVEDAKNLKLDP